MKEIRNFLGILAFSFSFMTPLHASMGYCDMDVDGDGEENSTPIYCLGGEELDNLAQEMRMVDFSYSGKVRIPLSVSIYTPIDKFNFVVLTSSELMRARQTDSIPERTGEISVYGVSLESMEWALNNNTHLKLSLYQRPGYDIQGEKFPGDFFAGVPRRTFEMILPKDVEPLYLVCEMLTKSKDVFCWKYPLTIENCAKYNLRLTTDSEGDLDEFLNYEYKFPYGCKRIDAEAFWPDDEES